MDTINKKLCSSSYSIVLLTTSQKEFLEFADIHRSHG